MLSLPKTYFDRSIKHMVLFSFFIVLLIPLGFSISSLYENSWSQAQQRMLEKHQLISETLVEPFTLFITSRQKSLSTLGEEILKVKTKHTPSFISEKKQKQYNSQSIQQVLDNYYNSFEDLSAVSFISSDNDIKVMAADTQGNTKLGFPLYDELNMRYLKLDDKTSSSLNLISPAFISKYTKKPVVLLNRYVVDDNNFKVGTIRAEVSLKYIESMCSKINFGVKGHCATVDQSGQVIAHPNKEWALTIRDLSKLSVVKKMMSGETGTTEFYSPFLKADMVAGYSGIPALGWGVMIPQPKAELIESFDTIKQHIYLWLIAGILITLCIAYILMKKITSPITNLVERTKLIGEKDDCVGLGEIPENSPSEIRLLWKSFARLLVGLQKSNKEVKELNISLESDVDKATKKLQEMNKYLYDISNQDYLTEISNRRYFNNFLENILKLDNDETVGIIVFDLDNFKAINDVHGHDIGDLALKHLANILMDCTRKADLVARLGGDEFAVYVKNLKDKELLKIAEKIRKTVETTALEFNETKLNITTSIGLVNYKKHKGHLITLDQLLVNADKALYQSKSEGRNTVSILSVEDKKSDEEKMEVISV